MAAKGITIQDYRTEIPGRLNADRTVWEFPQINSVDNYGHRTEWRIVVRVVEADTTANPIFVPIQDIWFESGPMPGYIAYTRVYSRIEGGRVRDIVPTFTSQGKNAGRANATNPFTQALRDALGIHNKHLKRAVNVQGQGGTPRYPPMLAINMSDHKHPLDFAAGVYIQRKYNGVRAVAMLEVPDDPSIQGPHVIFYSRTKQLYPGFFYIKDELLPCLRDGPGDGHLYLDGEIYCHGVPLQTISGLARREKTMAVGDEALRVDFMIYDAFIPSRPDMLYDERKKLIEGLFAQYGDHFKHVKPVETYRVHNEAEIQKYYKQFLSEDYEGAIVRLNLPYKYSNGGYHSHHLLKLKPVFDHEYKIVGWATGTKGKAAHALMMTCATETGEKFNVTPALEIIDRIKLAEQMATVETNNKTYFDNHYKGKMLIVYFDELNEDTGIPQRARTKMEIRTWE